MKPPSEPWVLYDGPMSSTASIAIEHGTSTVAGSSSSPEQPVATRTTTRAITHLTASEVRTATWEAPGVMKA